MFILNKPNENGTRTATNIRQIPNISLVLEGVTRAIYIGSQEIASGGAPEELTAQFNDLIEAYNSDEKVYDLDQPVGYWKPKPKPTRRKKEEPASGDSN